MDDQEADAEMLIRAMRIISSDDMDLSTKQSQLVDIKRNAITIAEDDHSEFVFYNWFCETTPRLSFCSRTNGSWFVKLVKRDDRITHLAYYTAFACVKKVLEEIIPNMSYGSSESIESIVQRIQEELLDSFDILCKDRSIEESWDVASIRAYILEGAYSATNYINSLDTHKLCFPGEDLQRYYLLSCINKVLLIGDPEQEFILKKNTSDNVVIEDDGTVGLSVHIQKIKDRLIGSNSKLDVIPIVGMGGIGKTTLARKVYKDPQIAPLFHVCAWIVVSQESYERDVFLRLLESIAPIPNEVHKENTQELLERLYRRLKGWRYFIVLDDIWSKEVWDCIKMCFPNDNNGSRIILTSRIIEVASHVDNENSPHFMSFLGIEDSWELLHKRVYGKDVCPHQLMNIGMQIAKKCQGLPLAIEVMAGHLSSNGKAQECWEDVANRVGFPTEVSQLESLSEILSICFHDLPSHLKTCFLTMTLFPKNFEISVRKLIQIWGAMGLCQSLQDGVKDGTSEEIAMSYFKSLTNRSLIMVKEKKFNGKAKLCGVHDIVWDLSMREFCKQFFCDNDQRSVIRITKTLLYFGNSFESDYPINFEGFKLLRVLDIVNQSFDYFPIDVTLLSNLRYLAFSTSDNIPNLIYKLQYLETILNYHKGIVQSLPAEIWLLQHLKHLHLGTCSFLCDPSSLCLEESLKPLLSRLLSLSNLRFSSCTKETFLNIPNLKQLGIIEDEQNDIGDELLCSALENLVSLSQLEKLKLCFNPKIGRPRCIPDWDSFLPNTMKKLTLSHSNLPWIKMKTLMMLPNLEVLKLKENAFKGVEWVMNDEEFLNLKYLLLDSLDLVLWKANEDNFPNLQQLIIKFCGTLVGIPRDFGKIYTLELIDLDFCGEYASAVEIQQEQVMFGNDKFNLKLGRILPVFQMMGYAMFFIWSTMKLITSKPKGEGPTMQQLEKASTAEK